ncbi:COMM domain-containing protein 3-like [Argonauta hians]
MEVSASVIQGLYAAGNTSAVPDDCFHSLVESACQGILTKSNIDGRLKKLDEDVYKETYGCISLLIAEATKNDADVNSLTTLLEECNFSKDRIKTFLDVFQENKPFLQALIANTTESLPHIVDVKWRLDYYIKSNHLERVHQPVYLLTLLSEVPGEKKLKELSFSCTVEQLQSLVSKLKDATRCLQRTAQL